MIDLHAPTVIGFWRDRSQSVDELAATTRAFLDTLAAIDPALVPELLLLGEHQSGHPADLSVEGLRRIYQRRKRDDSPSGSYVSGYSVDLVHPDHRQRQSLHLIVGKTGRTPNVVNVTLPRPEHAVGDASELLTARVGDAVLKAILDHWNAERGRWSVSKYARPQEELVLGKASSTSWTERREARKRWAKELQIGWETLIPPQVRLDRTLLPAVADIETVPAGTLVRLGDAPLDVDFEDILDLRRALGYPT
ncbi:hypothetical protein [Rhodococcus sp. 14-2483-1-2]|uniref:hypothetical protein n=1 Tax=Rhodococcus sp. 14-2483-1-2 TaxID=2023147 RepID=UPI000B9B3690|nr:hypothetical protein [Rhodococcus sp. 14-2483-1-2]OZF30726.1 hypothetical protein CH295_16820 [Rhodococcus sp. 14-2483-1-2]